MSILSRLADRLILCPSTDPLDPDGKQRVEIPVADDHVEAWVALKPAVDPNNATKLNVIKFPGAAGRAERGGLHPTEVWRNIDAEIWTINHRGYGGSSGPATIKSFPETASTVLEFIKRRNPDRPIFLVGNSLGCISALYLAARHDIAGMLLRNPPPIAEMIRTRPKYSWWNFGLSAWVAAEVPDELDSVQNAERSKTRCLFVQSEHDRVVPCRYQNLIIDEYAGPNRVFQIDAANHHHQVSENQQDEYLEAIRWLL